MNGWKEEVMDRFPNDDCHIVQVIKGENSFYIFTPSSVFISDLEGSTVKEVQFDYREDKEVTK